MMGLMTHEAHERAMQQLLADGFAVEWSKSVNDRIIEANASRDQWRELAFQALADLRELRKAVLAPPGEDAVPGVDPKTTREADAERARSLRERQEEEAA